MATHEASPTLESVAILAIRALEEEIRHLRQERDEFRNRWLKQVDANDKLRASLARDLDRMQNLEAMCRE